MRTFLIDLLSALGGLLLIWVIMVTAPGHTPPAQAAVRSDPFVRTLTDLDDRAERRHGELLIRIETLRRQMLALHGKKETR